MSVKTKTILGSSKIPSLAMFHQLLSTYPFSFPHTTQLYFSIYLINVQTTVQIISILLQFDNSQITTFWSLVSNNFPFYNTTFYASKKMFLKYRFVTPIFVRRRTILVALLRIIGWLKWVFSIRRFCFFVIHVNSFSIICLYLVTNPMRTRTLMCCYDTLNRLDTIVWMSIYLIHVV